MNEKSVKSEIRVFIENLRYWASDYQEGGQHHLPSDKPLSQDYRVLADSIGRELSGWESALLLTTLDQLVTQIEALKAALKVWES